MTSRCFPWLPLAALSLLILATGCKPSVPPPVEPTPAATPTPTPTAAATPTPAPTAPAASPAAAGSTVPPNLESAMAALDAQDKREIADGTRPPVDPFIKETNYPPPAGALFAAPDGVADRPGTDPAAPTTFREAVKRAPKGGTVVLRGGIYRNVNGVNVEAHPLTIQAYPKEKPRLRGSVVIPAADWIPDGNAAWRKDGWEKFPPAPRVGPEFLDPKFPLAAERDMVFVNGRNLTQVASREEVAPGKFYVNGDTKQLWIGENPAGRTVEGTVHTQCMQIYGTKEAPDLPAGSVLRGLTFEHFADNGVSVRSADVRVEDCTFAWNAQRGLNVFDCRNFIVRGCTMVANGRVGFRAARTPKLQVENNTFAFNNVERFRTAWDAAGLKLTETAYTPADGPVFRRNVFERNFSTGLWLDVDANHAVVTDNIARYNQGIGLFFEISEYAVFAFNVAHHNGSGLMISNAKFCKVFNNTLAHNATGLIVKQTGRKNEYPRVIMRTGSGELFTGEGNTLVNNLFLGVREGSPNPMLNATAPGSNVASPALVTAIEGNVYLRPDPTKPAAVVKWNLPVPNKPPNTPGSVTLTDYATLAEFSAATGFDRRALARDGAALNNNGQSLFFDETKSDYRLRPGNPALNRGEPLPADVAAAAGRPAGAPGFVGALGGR